MNLEVQLAALQVDKEDTAAAITEMGGTLSQNPGFDTFATDVRSIELNPAIKQLFNNTITEITEDMFVEGATSIKNYSCASCATLTTVTLPDTIITTGNYTFTACNGLQNINTGNIKTFQTECLSNCNNLTAIDLSSAVTIGTGAFRNDSSLTTIKLPATVTTIGATAFQNCTSLTSITILKTTPPALSNANAFTNTNDCPIYVPAESVSAYQAATNWSTLATRIQAIPTT